MKTTGVVVILSFLVFVLSANRLLAAPDAVRDKEGKEVITGEKYYIVPVDHNIGGGLTTGLGISSKLHCLQDVILAPPRNRGKPVKFFPGGLKSDVVHVLTDLFIEQEGSEHCVHALFWKLDELDPKFGQFFVTADDKTLITLKNMFRIEKVGRPDRNYYKFMFCHPSMCKDLGICDDEHDVGRLCISDRPLEVVFEKDN